MTLPMIAPPRRSVIETADPEEAVAFLGSTVRSTVHSTGVADGSPLRYSRIDAGAFSLDDFWLPVEYTFHIEPSGCLNISHRIRGTGERHSRETSDRYGPGDLYIAGQPDQPYEGRSAGSASADGYLQLAYLDLALLAQVAATEPAHRSGPVRFTSRAPMSAAAADCWKAARSHAAGLLANPDTASQPLLTGTAARLLAAAALATFPSNILMEPTAIDRHDACGATARRAAAYIEEHAHEDISSADIAAAAHVTIRAVQLAFRRHLATSPMAYLRRIRLDRAHRQLMDADPARESVTAVAYRWGFASPGRFAAYYRAAYGVPPSQTLRS